MREGLAVQAVWANHGPPMIAGHLAVAMRAVGHVAPAMKDAKLLSESPLSIAVPSFTTKLHKFFLVLMFVTNRTDSARDAEPFSCCAIGCQSHAASVSQVLRRWLGDKRAPTIQVVHVERRCCCGLVVTPVWHMHRHTHVAFVGGDNDNVEQAFVVMGHDPGKTRSS